MGEFVLSDPATAVPMTIQQLAAGSGTSDASVIRLARSIGCSGYREFRTLLAACIAAESAQSDVGSGNLPADITEDDPASEVVRKLLAEERQALADTAAAVSEEALGAAADAVLASRRIVVAGIGASGLVALDLSAKLERIGIISQAVVEGHSAMTHAALLQPDDLFIAVSASGETRDMLAPLEHARSLGVPTVAITVRPGSGVTSADHVLLGVAARESGMRPAAMSSRTSQMFLVDALFTLIFQRSAEVSSAAISTSHRLLAPRRRGKEYA